MQLTEHPVNLDVLYETRLFLCKAAGHTGPMAVLFLVNFGNDLKSTEFHFTHKCPNIIIIKTVIKIKEISSFSGKVKSSLLFKWRCKSEYCP